MATRLTHKEKGFADDYAKGMTGTEAALNNYDTQSEGTAAVIAHENLRKPKIIEYLGLDEESLKKKHIQLLNQKKLDYFVFPKYMDDDEIMDLVEEDTGIKVINVRETEKGKMAWYETEDSLVQDKALDKAYKLTGKYAPEKQINVNVEVESTPELQRAAEILNEQLRISITSNGTETSAVGAETQDKE